MDAPTKKKRFPDSIFILIFAIKSDRLPSLFFMRKADGLDFGEKVKYPAYGGM